MTSDSSSNSQQLKKKVRGIKWRTNNVLLAARGRPTVARRPTPRERTWGGNPLRQYFENNDARMVHKWMHYFDIYDRHFQQFRGTPVTVVEFGVYQGGSLQMWRDYFGPKAHIVGVDINPQCADMADGQTEIVIGDQEDRTFLRQLAERLGTVDVVVEDGGHTMNQQINTFEELWPFMSDGGVFLVEDLHTSYWTKYGGGYRRPGTFIEYAKNLIDQQHAWHSADLGFAPDTYTRTITGMHAYDSIIVFDKGNVERPSHRKTGHRSV